MLGLAAAACSLFVPLRARRRAGRIYLALVLDPRRRALRARSSAPTARSRSWCGSSAGRTGSSRASPRSPASCTSSGRSRRWYSSSRCFVAVAPRRRAIIASHVRFYKHHVFFCLNRRDAPENCCACHGSEAMRDYAKKRIKELKLARRGQGPHQPGRLPRPLRGRPVHRRLPRGGLVHLRRQDRTSTRSSTSTW